VAVEPVAANMGVVPPAPGFLAGLRKRCDQHGALLLFDEVITGFRVGRGGAQERFDVRPDLTTLGKVMGGGFPCAAFGGRRDIMQRIAPAGPVYQAGTLAGNPVAVAAGIATLDLIAELDPYRDLDHAVDALIDGLGRAFAAKGIPARFGREGPLFSVFFAEVPVSDLTGAAKADHERYARFFHHLLAHGVALPPSGYEMWTMSTTHGPEEVAQVLGAAASFAG
jgi:glutamate-1-semialdehyde 2,1-aminomutase